MQGDCCREISGKNYRLRGFPRAGFSTEMSVSEQAAFGGALMKRKRDREMSEEQKRRSARRRRRKRYRIKGRFYVFLLICALCLFGMVRCTMYIWEEKGNLMDKDKEKDTTTGSAFSIVDKSSWELTLVNSEHELPEDFTVETAKIEGGSGKEFDKRAVEKLNQMLAEAASKGLNVVVCSAYRTVEYQEGLFEDQVKKYMAAGMSEADARAKTATEIAVPGTSEHNLGLAVDLVANSYQKLDEAQADTAENKWLLANCARYGFVVRYPKDKQEITKIIYEPWHFRYVGELAAQQMTEKGLCLEEYLAQ